MDVLNPVYLRALVTGVIVASVWIWILIKEGRQHSKDELIFTAIIIVVYVASGVSASFAYSLNPTYGMVHYGFILVSLVLIILFEYSIFDTSFIGFVIVLSMMGTFSLLAAAVPKAVLPYFRSQVPSPIAQVPPNISSESITMSFSRIRTALSDIESNISRETKNIDQSIKDLTNEIENRNKRLELLRAQQSQLSEEVERYKKLASLTRDQTQALVRELRREKYIDYAVGLVIGIFSSGLFLTMQKSTWRRRRLNVRNGNTL